MSFTERCVADSLTIWEQCLNSPFLQKLESGTLDPACFLGYIVDDSLYLREYAKVFAWGMTKATTLEQLRTYYSLLAFVNEEEGSTRLSYLRHFGLTDAAIQNLPQRPANREYTAYMLDAAKNGGMAECMMACLPCMLSYCFIFQKLLHRSPAVQDTDFWPLIRDYAGDGYEAACRVWSETADRICAGLTPERQEVCREIFRECSLYELRFWQMSAEPRSDIPFPRET